MNAVGTQVTKTRISHPHMQTQLIANNHHEIIAHILSYVTCPTRTVFCITSRYLYYNVLKRHHHSECAYCKPENRICPDPCDPSQNMYDSAFYAAIAFVDPAEQRTCLAAIPTKGSPDMMPMHIAARYNSLVGIKWFIETRYYDHFDYTRAVICAIRICLQHKSTAVFYYLLERFPDIRGGENEREIPWLAAKIDRELVYALEQRGWLYTEAALERLARKEAKARRPPSPPPPRPEDVISFSNLRIDFWPS